MRKSGLACDNLVGADVVTADGRLVHASETENADLLWGLRGGGGNFGIVTQFELALHPVGPIVYAGPIFYAADADRDLLRAFREWAADAPDEITALVNLTTAPPLPVIPEQWHGKKVAAFIAASTAYVNFLGDTDAARSSYGDETYARLVSLKNDYDPTNVFRLNQNIEPQSAGS